MKHNAFRSRYTSGLPIAWREAECAALRANAADTYDDRVSDNMFDIEDERAEVDIIAHRGFATKTESCVPRMLRSVSGGRCISWPDYGKVYDCTF